MELFPHNLTPVREHLFRKVRKAIRDQTLQTSDLMLLLLHLREIKLHEDFFEWGSSVAHSRRNRGTIWQDAVDIWATHAYFAQHKSKPPPLKRLPVWLFNSFFLLIDHHSEWQLEKDFGDLFSGKADREELKATLRHLYAPPKQKRDATERGSFVFLVHETANSPDDLRFVRRLIKFCDSNALNVPPRPMSEFVSIFESALQKLRVTPWRLTPVERRYLQLHLLVCMHNTIVEVDYDLIASVLERPSRAYTAMLSVSAMYDHLTLDIAFYYRDVKGNLEQVDLESSDERFPTLTYPVIATDLPEKSFLLESDENIRACLFNHPLEITMHREKPRLIALERHRCPFPPTKNRAGGRQGAEPLLASFRKYVKGKQP